MKIKELGGEFALIDHLATIVPTHHANLIVGMGDDAAVIRMGPEPAPYLLSTTDILVEGHHFKRQWSTPEQIGAKAAECNISDIAAMGGTPTWMFISLVLTKDTDVTWAQKLYSGISTACQRHKCIVAGGDTTRGPTNVINITLLGTVTQEYLCLRSHARPGDHLMVTGVLGASSAAFHLLSQGQSPCEELLEKHLMPRCRLDVSCKIAPIANAMIDISDGLGSEVHHICRHSKVDAQIIADAIPINDAIRQAGEKLGMNPIDFALSGGEDFELLFSISEDNLPLLTKTGVSYHRIGRILPKNEGPLLVTAQGERPLPKGYNHF